LLRSALPMAHRPLPASHARSPDPPHLPRPVAVFVRSAFPRGVQRDSRPRNALSL
jgi:hypothetical protein